MKSSDKNENKILAIIPARGGSKGIPRKNIVNLGDKPLLAYSIEAAFKSTSINRTVVSTEDEEIAAIAKDFGAEVPVLRPQSLAQDDTPGIEVVLHTIKQLAKTENYKPQLIILLQPTSPFCSADDIDSAVSLFKKKKADSVVSVCLVKHHPYWMKSVSPDGQMRDFMKTKQDITRRQLLPPVYRLNGAIYLTKSDILLNERSFHPKKTYAYIMPQARSIDIDDELDLGYAEFLLNRDKNEKDY